MKPIGELYTVRRRNLPRHQHHPPSRFCSPTKCAVVLLVVLVVVGAFIGLIFGLVLPRDPQEQAPQACTKGYERVPFIQDTHCVDVDECNGYPVLCTREFRCTNLPGSYRCEPCGVGHVASPDGRSCFPVPAPPPTDPDPCDKENICYWLPLSECYSSGSSPGYRCLCPEGYKEENRKCIPLGYIPETDNPCKKISVCREKPNSVCFINADRVGHSCVCAKGYEDKNGICLPRTDACQRNNVCVEKPYSVCYMRDNTGIFYCICAHGYIEVRGVCQVRTQCSSQSCLNGGVCVTTNEQHVCLCQPGYSGEICQTVSHCLSNPCQHGVCVDAFNGFYCQCNKDWTGDLCDLASHCLSNPCQHGVCVDAFNGFYCQCNEGWIGDLCDLVPDDCSNNDCDLRHSVCVEGGGSYYCLCDERWEGSLCNEQIPTTTATPETTTTATPEITTTTTADPCAAGITWTTAVGDCIKGHNEETVNVASNNLEACKILCEQATSFVCCSVDYRATDGLCYLSSDNRVSAGADYKTPCHLPNFVLTEVASCPECPSA